jgi:hypothetical protein
MKSHKKLLTDEIVISLMKKMPTYDGIMKFISSYLESQTDKFNFFLKINQIKSATLPKLEFEMDLTDNNRPTLLFICKLKKFLITHPSFFPISIIGILKSYVTNLFNAMNAYWILYGTFNNENIEKYNSLVQKLRGDIMIKEISYYSYKYINENNKHKAIYDSNENKLEYQSYENQNLLSSIVYKSKFSLNTIDLPENYKEIIKEVQFTTNTFIYNLNQLPNIDSIINITDSQIDLEIENEGNANSFFVLPSQLNGTEYQSSLYNSIVTKINNYKDVSTGGSKGQLAVHPSIGQFILDNACNDNNKNGINSLKYLLENLLQHHSRITLKNGYLVVPEHNEQYYNFLDNLNELMIICMEDVLVDGYYYDRENLPIKTRRPSTSNDTSPSGRHSRSDTTRELQSITPRGDDNLKLSPRIFTLSIKSSSGHEHRESVRRSDAEDKPSISLEKNVEPSGRNYKNHLINIIYASSIPINSHTNPYQNYNLVNIANYIMIGQYYGSLQHAYIRALREITRPVRDNKYINSKMKIYLLLLGGGGFSNHWTNIFCNIIISIKLLELKYNDVAEKLDIHILTWKNNKNEFNTFSNLKQEYYKK